MSNAIHSHTTAALALQNENTSAFTTRRKFLTTSLTLAAVVAPLTVASAPAALSPELRFQNAAKELLQASSEVWGKDSACYKGHYHALINYMNEAA